MARVVTRYGGYVRLYRSLLENPVFRNPGEAMFFAYLVVLANWRAGTCRYDERVYKLERGDLVIGERKLAADFGWSRNKVRRVNRVLTGFSMIVRKWDQHGNQRAPVVTICNYDKFQLDPAGGNQESNQDPPNPDTKTHPPKNKGNKSNQSNQEENNPLVLSAEPDEHACTPDIEVFEHLWRTFPARQGAKGSKRLASQAFHRNIKNRKASIEVYQQAHAAYTADLQAKGQIGTQYVMQADRWFKTAWENEIQQPNGSAKRPDRPGQHTMPADFHDTIEGYVYDGPPGKSDG